MQPARFRHVDLLIEIYNAKFTCPAVSSGRRAGTSPEWWLVIKPTCRYHWKDLFLLQKLSIDKPNFSQKWWCQKWNKDQGSSWVVSDGTGVNGLWARNWQTHFEDDFVHLVWTSLRESFSYIIRKLSSKRFPICKTQFASCWKSFMQSMYYKVAIPRYSICYNFKICCEWLTKLVTVTYLMVNWRQNWTLSDCCWLTILFLYFCLCL